MTTTGVPLLLFAARNGDSIDVQIRCDSMELTAEVVQDIARFFKITELESSVNFPKEMEAFEDVLKQVAEFNALRIRMSADMADDSQRVKVRHLSCSLVCCLVLYGLAGPDSFLTFSTCRR
jgi:hypothetical protein